MITNRAYTVSSKIRVILLFFQIYSISLIFPTPLHQGRGRFVYSFLETLKERSIVFLLYVMSTIGYISICAELRLEQTQFLKQIFI
jgi:hypothetical protein